MKKVVLFLFAVLSSPLFAGAPMFDVKTQNLYLCDSLKYSYTTTSSTTTTYASVTYEYKCKKSGFLFWKKTKCSLDEMDYQYSTNTTSTTTEYVADNNSGVGDGFYVFNAFPWGQVCDRDVFSATWRAIRAVCSGYNEVFRNDSRTVDQLDGAANCWKWSCKPGFASLGGGECVNQEECTARSLRWTGSACEGFTFCPGWDRYSASVHVPVLRGNCYQYRCKTPNYGFQAEGDATCIKASGLYTRGGTYVNNGLTDTGVIQRCDQDHFNDFQDGRYVCKEIKRAPKARFDACWGCKTKGNLVKCLTGTTIPDECKVRG